MINCLIFSRDRACQLDLLLRSIRDNLKGIDRVDILIKTTEDCYLQSYLSLFDQSFDESNLDIHWHFENSYKDFKSAVMDIVRLFKEPYTIVFSDDDVVIRPVDLDIIKHYKEDVNAISLRMGKHITYCYAKDVYMDLPQFVEQDGYILWNWQQYRRDLDWGYPMSMAGNIWRTEPLKELWNKIGFTAPNWIEGYMVGHAPQDKPFTVSFKEQHVYNVANNLVQTVCKNRHSGKYPVEELNRKFLDGYRISTETLYGKTFNSANGEAEYKLIKGE